KINEENSSQIVDLINRAGYPPPTEGAINPDLTRLIELLDRQRTDRLLSPAEVIALIEQANSIRESVAAGDLSIALSADRVRELIANERNIIGALLSHLNAVIIRSDAIQQLVNQIIGEQDTAVDNIRFGEVAAV